jgi:hypothetical protein
MDSVILPETAVQAEELCDVNGDIEMKDSKLKSVDETSIGASISAMKKSGASILHALTADELRDHMRSLNHDTCPVSPEPFGSHWFYFIFCNINYPMSLSNTQSEVVIMHFHVIQAQESVSFFLSWQVDSLYCAEY